MAGSCLVCGGGDLDRLTWMVSPFDRTPFRRIGQCRRCGHIQIDPLPSDDDLSRAHTLFFGSKYHTVGRDEAHANRMARVLSALEPWLTPDGAVLDIGAGEGWLLDGVRERGGRYMAIEPVDSFAERIRARGGDVIGATLDDVPPDRRGEADAAVFRHVLEHLKDPRAALSAINALLRPGGHLYLALPNAMQIDSNKGFRTSYLRPVHVSYFHPDHVAYLLRQTGFDVVWDSRTGETAMVARKTDDVAVTEAPPDLRAEQRARFQARARQTRSGDLQRLPRLLAGWVKRRMAAAGAG